ncbi:ArsR family transcriptional regulator [Nanoarchaeota archaeon NZ13-N]|nr:MAG: ArsR family transcriptional regulator [Nanoarchaeota archaeon NZ13-N]
MNVIEKRIIEALQQNPYGLTISELSRLIKINRITLSKHLEILRERGYLGYRIVGKAKVWYLSEDINLLEIIYNAESVLNKMLRFDDEKKNYVLGDMKFVIIPIEILQILYLELKDYNVIRNIGKRFGILIGTVYKTYSGTEKIVREDVLERIVKLYEKMGFGNIENVEINMKEVNMKITASNIVETEVIKDIEEVIEDKDKIRNYFSEGFFEGLFSVLLTIPFKCSEVTNPLKSDKSIFELSRA